MLPFNWGDTYPERVTLDDRQVQDNFPERVTIDNGQDQTKAEAQALGIKYGLRVNETEVRLTFFKLTLILKLPGVRSKFKTKFYSIFLSKL